MIPEIKLFEYNRKVFESLFEGITKQEYLWRETDEKWNLLEIVCHLYDEEREDFRARLKSVLDHPDKEFIKIDPVAWVQGRKYIEQDFKTILDNFIEERNQSIEWLKSLRNPSWENAFNHPKVGPITGKFLLANWLAHDYLHFRQITRIKYNYLKFISGENLNYAGDW